MQNVANKFICRIFKCIKSKIIKMYVYDKSKM